MSNSNNIISEECVIISERFERSIRSNKNFQRLYEKYNQIQDDLRTMNVYGKYRNHKLSGFDCNELHIDGDVLLIWKYYRVYDTTFLFLLDMTNHKQLGSSASNYRKTIKRLIQCAESVANSKAKENINMNESVCDDDIKAIDKFIEDLYNLRKESITKDGEFGIGNLIFKEFRKKGYLDKLKELKIEFENKEMSLENLQN